MKQEKVVCRPCKEENNWEIQGPDGQVKKRHYQTRQECVQAGDKMATEYGCDLTVEGQNQSQNQSSFQSMKKNTQQSMMQDPFQEEDDE